MGRRHPLRLRRWRIARNRTQAWLADQVGVHVNTVGRWERGDGISRRHPRVPALAAALACSKDELLLPG